MVLGLNPIQIAHVGIETKVCLISTHLTLLYRFETPVQRVDSATTK